MCRIQGDKWDQFSSVVQRGFKTSGRTGRGRGGILEVSASLRFLFMLDLLSLASAFRLPETGLLGVIVMDYVGFAVLYCLIQAWQSWRFAEECRALVGTYNVSDAVARKLVRYWCDWLGRCGAPIGPEIRTSLHVRGTQRRDEVAARETDARELKS